MFSSSANIIFIIVLVVIFIVRSIAQVTKRKGEEEPPPIPVHFEDDDEEPQRVHGAIRSAPRPKPPVIQAGKLDQYRPLTQTVLPSSTAAPGAVAAPRAPSAGMSAAAGAAPPARKGITLNLNLSAMKQAVVMAEILGTPRGMQEPSDFTK